MTHAVAPQAIADVNVFLVSGAPTLVCRGGTGGGRRLSRTRLTCSAGRTDRLQRCHERCEEVIDAFFDLADTSSTVRGLIRQGFLPAGLKGGGQLVAHPLRGMGARAAHPETWWPSRCLARISGVTSCRSPGRELDPTVAPMAWKMAFSRSPLPRGSVEGT
jgi:hypothetical protein